MSDLKKYNVAVVGATGLVGQMILKVLEEYQFPVKMIRPLASFRSAGQKIIYNGEEVLVEALSVESFANIEIAFFSAGGAISLEYCPIASRAGAIVIDNSSAFRNDAEIPLVVPEVNRNDLKMRGIIANPNCSTIQSVLPLKALDNQYGLRRVVYSTYQSVSGSGMRGINDLESSIAGDECEFYPYPIAKTCIPEIDSFLDNGYTKEEMKMVNETRKILHLPNLPVSATCVRVPVRNCHGVSIMVELDKPFELDEVKKVLADYPGLVVLDNPAEHIYPVSTVAIGHDLVYVGRIRKDLSCHNGLMFYTVADNIRKGAASNAVQIALELIELQKSKGKEK